MTTDLIISGILATLRAVQSGADLYSEHARNRSIYLPNVDLGEMSNLEKLTSFIKDHQELVVEVSEIGDIWNPSGFIENSASEDQIQKAYAYILQYELKQKTARPDVADHETDEKIKLIVGSHIVQSWKVEQFSESKAPPTPFARFSLVLLDISLEFVSTNPSLMGANTKGEKLLISFAEKVEALIPNDVNKFGTNDGFKARLAGVFFRAALSSVNAHQDQLVSEKKLGTLMNGVLEPIINGLPENLNDQFSYRKLCDALMGPVAEATLQILADNTELYFGDNFKSESAMGIVTRTIFEEAKLVITDSGNFVDVFSEAGITSIYKTCLSLAIQQPDLFTGKDVSGALFKDLLKKTSTTLEKSDGLKGPFGSALAAEVIKVVGDHAAFLIGLDNTDSWEKLALDTMNQVTDGLSEFLDSSAADRPLSFKRFTYAQIIELGRLVIQRVGSHPEMVGVNREEIKQMVRGVADIISKDENLLLNHKQWLEVASSLIEQASANSGRLFKLNQDDQGDALATQVISAILLQAKASIDESRDSGMRSFLSGDTLEAVLIIAIESLGGNISGLRNNPASIKELVQLLLTKAQSDPDKFGTDKWLECFESLLISN